MPIQTLHCITAKNILFKDCHNLDTIIMPYTALVRSEGIINLNEFQLTDLFSLCLLDFSHSSLVEISRACMTFFNLITTHNREHPEACNFFIEVKQVEVLNLSKCVPIIKAFRMC